MGIATKNKKEFLDFEYEYFKVSLGSKKKYLEVMLEDIRICNECNTIYWNGCVKRCNCK